MTSPWKWTIEYFKIWGKPFHYRFSSSRSTSWSDEFGISRSLNRSGFRSYWFWHIDFGVSSGPLIYRGSFISMAQRISIISCCIAEQFHYRKPLCNAGTGNIERRIHDSRRGSFGIGKIYIIINGFYRIWACYDYIHMYNIHWALYCAHCTLQLCFNTPPSWST